MSEGEYRIFLILAYKALNDQQRIELKSFLTEHKDGFIHLDTVNKMVIVINYLQGMLSIPDI